MMLVKITKKLLVYIIESNSSHVPGILLASSGYMILPGQSESHVSKCHGNAAAISLHWRETAAQEKATLSFTSIQ